MKQPCFIFAKNNILYLLTFVTMFICGMCIYSHIISPKNIAVLYIMTNRYTVFWEDFYKSAEKNFLPNHNKHYFVFTDDEKIPLPHNTTRIKAKYKNFPDVTLKRYEMFLEIKEQLKQYDYVYFFNANALIIKPINEEIFPTQEQGLAVAIHPAFWKNFKKATYERNKKSMAYVPYGQGKYYVQGSFYGGHVNAFLQMSTECLKNIQIDERNNIMAIWHDESHLNKYILDKNPLFLTPEYNWASDCHNPHSYKIPKNNIKMILREKEDKKYGGRKYLRGFTERKKTNSYPTYILEHNILEHLE